MSDYFNQMGHMMAVIGHAVPAISVVAAGLVCFGILVCFQAWLEGRGDRWLTRPTWLVLIIFGPVALFLLIPWCMAVYS